MAKSITMIPQTRKLFTASPITSVRKRRVAGYARVSTGSDEQFTSYEAQVDYYTNYIKSNPDWEFVSVYTDEGISGTNTKHRDGFNRMIEDALAGKIDLIVTKSVSRFARNTVDSLVTIRKLKEHGCECYFEKEGIFTFDSKGELLITIMSSLAQEESRSISENVIWGQRKRFADGKVCMPYSHFLGYDKGEDGIPVINESEAAIVRLIYRLFLDGKTPFGICQQLEEMEIKTPAGKTKWCQSTIISILSNEKYKGDALLQKTFTVDFLTKTKKKNEGEIQQYYVEGSHEAIITPEEFDMVQAELLRRKRAGRSYSGNSIFASKLICADCGGTYGQKVWHSTDAYRKVIWRCNRKFDKKNGLPRCDTPTLDEEMIKRMFLKAYNTMMGSREQLLEDCEIMRQTLADYSEQDRAIDALNEEIEVVAEMVKAQVRDNASRAQSQEEYNKKREALVQRYETACAELERQKQEKLLRIAKERDIRLFIANLKTQPLALQQWDEQVWTQLMDSAVVFRNGSIEFTFKNGQKALVEAD